jgi:quercetin dioxygenase-like cupin family protein
MAEDLEIYLLDFDPGHTLDSEAHAAGTEEYLTILEGAVYVRAGSKEATLSEGDFILYNCDIDHVIENRGKKKARVHMVVRFTQKQWP